MSESGQNEDLLAFAPKEVSAITGLSEGQLEYWRNTDLFTPTLANEPRVAFGRLYTFRDVVGLRTMSVLINEHNIPTRHLRKIQPWLKEQSATPWASLRLHVAGREIFIHDDEIQRYVSSNPGGQTALELLDIAPVVTYVRDRIAKLRQRTHKDVGRIEQTPYTLGNRPRLAKTRIPTSLIWELSQEDGWSEQQILERWPYITVEDIHAAVQYERDHRAA